MMQAKKYFILLFFIVCGFSLTLEATNGEKEKEKEVQKFDPDELFNAVRGGRIETVRDLIVSGGADVNMRNSEGFTPLHIAVAGNSGAMILELADLGANINIRDVQAQQRLQSLGHARAPWWQELSLAALTPLEYALFLTEQRAEDERARTFSIIRLLLDLGTNLNPQDVRLTPLHVAATLSRGSDLISYLLSNGAYVNLANNRGTRPAEMSILYGSANNLSNLLISGANTNEPNRNLLNLALQLIEKGYLPAHIETAQIIYFLLEFGVSLAPLTSEQRKYLLNFMSESPLLNAPFINILVGDEICRLEAEEFEQSYEEKLKQKQICFMESYKRLQEFTKSLHDRASIETYFLFAVARGNVSAVHFIAEGFGANFTQSTQDQAFTRAAQLGYVDIFSYLYTIFHEQDNAPLLTRAFNLAAENEQLDVIKFLFDRGHVTPEIIDFAFAKAIEREQVQLIVFFNELSNQLARSPTSPRQFHLPQGFESAFGAL